MNRESAGLVLTGALLGVLALSATVFARLFPPAREETVPAPAVSTAAFAAVRETAAPAAQEQTGAEQEAVPVLAACDTTAEAPEAGPYYVAVAVPDPAPGEKLFVCDGLGCPLAGIEPDLDGDASVGPLPPGRYSIQRGQTEIGSFTLLENAALSEAEGRAWTDGERLYVERFTPGTVRLTVRLHATGRYTLELRDRDGRSWSRELFIPPGARADAAGAWVRVLDFQGLPPGLYTAARQNHPLGQTELAAGEIAALEVEIDK